MKTPPLFRLALALSSVCLAAGSASAQKAHQHGSMKLDVALEGSKLALTMEAPLDNLLGFERAPRTDAERQAAAEVLKRLRSPDQGQPLFVMDAAAQCTLRTAEVISPVLEVAGDVKGAKDGHADLEASYEYSCAQPDRLRSLEVALFAAYKRVQRIDVQMVGPKGQSKVTLRRPAQKVNLPR